MKRGTGPVGASAGKGTDSVALSDDVELLRRRLTELEGGAPDAARELAARSAALAERVKELKCLYSISRHLKGRFELRDILQHVAGELPAALQYPEPACASITLRARKYHSPGYREPVCHLQAPIVVNGEEVGAVELGYADVVIPAGVPVFLPEEHVLLSTVAERLAEVVSLKETQHQLATHQEHLQSLASELTLAEERERRSLALALHDRIGQSLAVARLKLEALKLLLPPQHHARLDDVSSLIKQIVAETRSLTFEISPPILYELGLPQAVRSLADQTTRQFGLPVAVQCDEDLFALAEGVRVMVFRSVQELLTNTVKHAQASRATVRLLNDADQLSVVVEDDGVGFDASAQDIYPSAAGGFGLFSIRERIGHLGGRVTIESAPGKGTRIQLSVPCNGDGDGAEEDQ